jgi:hypothetical protein
VGLIKTDVSEEDIASNIVVAKIGKLRITSLGAHWEETSNHKMKSIFFQATATRKQGKLI